MVYEQERKYDIMRNSAGELLIVIRARLSSQEKPKLVYDGGEHALLYRNGDNTVVLDYINPQVRPNLASAVRVLIVEAQDVSVVREYFSVVEKIEHVELPQPLVA